MDLVFPADLSQRQLGKLLTMMPSYDALVRLASAGQSSCKLNPSNRMADGKEHAVGHLL
jgi:hypothetical protein